MDLFLIANICETPDVLKAIRLIKDLLRLAALVLPLILIVMSIIDIGKAALMMDPKALIGKFGIALKRLVLIVLIFFTPTLVNAVASLLEDGAANVTHSYSTCFSNTENIEYYEKLEKERQEEEKNKEKNELQEFSSKLKENTKASLAEAKEKKKATTNIFSSSAPNISSGTYRVNGNKYNLTDSELRKIASICQHEQGNNPDGVRAEATLMANKYELANVKNKSLYQYVMDSKWWASRSKQGNNASESSIAATKSALVAGNRSFPLFVDEHDCMDCNSKNRCNGGFKGDICSLTTNGTTLNTLSAVKDKKNYVSQKTVIKNVYGSTYTFYSFPSSSSDPFGYTAESYRKAKGG